VTDVGDALKQFGLRAISGEDRSPAGHLARLATAAVEPAYAAAMRVRNRLYDRGLKRSHDLGRPAISVGNLTTGGTGKTPVVEWLARRLLGRGRHPAVLMRGYGAKADEDGDELRVLRRALGDAVPVHANPSRVEGAAAVLRDRPETDVFLLDDAFQHRRARRAFDLVLVSATNPFGFGHVLPRGLLREPPAGLRRATAVLLTRCDAVNEEALVGIERGVHRYHPGVPIYRAEHVHAALWDPATDVEQPVSVLASTPFFAVAGIGDPGALHAQLGWFGGSYVGHRWFADHHAYTAADVEEIRSAAGQARVVTTDKDWVKLSDVLGLAGSAISVLRLAVRFRGDDGDRMSAQVLAAVGG
jgi:tetraacyldisaccharide 4'-kinase